MYNNPSNEIIRHCLGLPEQDPFCAPDLSDDEHATELEPLEFAEDVDEWMIRAAALIESMPDGLFTEILEEILEED